MYVRTLGNHEIMKSLHLAWEVFAQDMIPQCTNEEIEAFQHFIKYENLMPKVDAGEIKLFGVWEQNELCGMSILRENGHLQLILVKKDKQKQGYGKMLVQKMGQYLLKTKGITHMTAHALPAAVEIYEKLGFKAIAEEQSCEGRVFVPMEMEIPSKVIYDNAKTKKDWIRGLIIAAIIGFLVFTVFSGWIVYKVVSFDWKGVGNKIEEFHPDEYFGGEYFGDDYYPGGSFGEEESLSGIEAIPSYEENNLDFEVGEGSYILNTQDAGTHRTAVEFEIYYPQLSGLEASVEEKVNQELEKCAMETAERIYLNPTDDIKEKVLGEANPVLMSCVEYKVTYLTEEFISVVYQDYYYEGSEQEYYLELRTRNINLLDGTVYEVKDIVDLSDRFIKNWSEEMCEEADRLDLLEELSKEEMKAVLAGDELGGIYKDNFFLDLEGMEIGLSFKYPQGDKNNSGYYWVTAPFDWDDIVEFRTESEFWDLIK